MGNVEVAYGLLGSGLSILHEKTWIFPPSHSLQTALEWCLELSTEISAWSWVVVSSWLGWQNTVICMKLSNQAWSSFIVTVDRSGILARIQPPPPLSKTIDFCSAYWLRNAEKVYFPFHRKILMLIMSRKNLVTSSRIPARCFFRF